VAVNVACALVWLEAAVSLAAASALVTDLVRGAVLPGASVALAVIALGVAAALAGAGVALRRGGRRWARSPVLTVQLLVAALAVAAWSAGPWPWPAVALVVAVTTVVALLTRAAVTWTVPGRQTKA
jgi:hypothetical protein